ncbi:MAG: 50S ribosomal protein L18 [Deinococcus sp.]|nr:50S ribosomal protein L18 [Deinococcus sp.]
MSKRVTGRERRHLRLRRKIRGTLKRPRLAVFRSIRHIYAQIIDDSASRTLVAASSHGLEKAKRREQAALVGKVLAEKAQAAGITAVVFDRGGYRYHGRVKALAEAARASGLRF